MNKDISFEEYYKHYLSLHQNKWCRRLHFFGQLVTLTLFWYSILTKNWILLLLVPFVIYPFAWSGHFFFEKNKPAAWSNPYWAKICDWKMFKDVLFGRIKW
tara:strand:- start:680 stop:982 length:303 start_codon:yes stop_codon:yes gene_type:complete